MYDKTLVLEILLQIKEGADKIHSSREFYDSDANRGKLDSICMMLIAIGESLKKIDKITDGKLLSGYPQVD